MNITLAIDEDLVQHSRNYASRRGTTLNALIREHLQSLVDAEKRVAEARKGMARLMESSILEFDPDTDIKELSRSRDTQRFHGHEHSDPRSGKQTA
ncbi:MAG: hypothetical protein OXR62_07440 [Ahrensia sp.]|nr:hypothetical protein [Ahrensia sp.]